MEGRPWGPNLALDFPGHSRRSSQERKEGVVPQGRTPWGLTARAAQRQELNDASVYDETHRALSLL